jgi:hypothetical protein
MEYGNKRLLYKRVVKTGDRFNIVNVMCSFRILTEGNVSYGPTGLMFVS